METGDEDAGDRATGAAEMKMLLSLGGMFEVKSD